MMKIYALPLIVCATLGGYILLLYAVVSTWGRSMTTYLLALAAAVPAGYNVWTALRDDFGYDEPSSRELVRAYAKVCEEVGRLNGRALPQELLLKKMALEQQLQQRKLL